MNVRRLAIPLLLWSIPACLTVMQMQAAAYVDHRPFLPLGATIPALSEWLIWVPATPVVLALVEAFPVWPRLEPRSIVVHACGVLGASLLRRLVYATATVLFIRPPVAFAEYLLRLSVAWLPAAALVYGTIVVAAVALHYSREASAGAIRSASLESALARAESTSIRAQLNPHFLFNSLHSVGALVRANDAGGAVQMLSDIGELLRESFARHGVDYAALQNEIAFARRYLAIEQVRFRDRLDIQWDIEPGVGNALVPRLLLQPLVENAIRHGIAKRSAAGRISITACRTGSKVHLTVRDDGPGFDGSELTSDGVGLSATRARLSLLYGIEGSLAFTSGATSGACVEVSLPFRTA